jgi:hypothetical protein
MTGMIAGLLAQRAAQRDQRDREAAVTAVLTRPCPLCGAPPGEGCDVTWLSPAMIASPVTARYAPYAELNQGVIAHLARLEGDSRS